MKKIYLAVFVCVLVLAAVCNANAATVYAGNVTITKVIGNNDNNGDVIFVFSSPGPAGCEVGGWLNSSAPGFKSLVALITSAYLAKSTVSVFMYNDQLYPGTIDHYCRVNYITLQ